MIVARRPNAADEQPTAQAAANLDGVFAALAALPLTSAERLRFFQRLPDAVRRVAWRELRAAVERAREGPLP
jgi:hypothetical protein